MYWGLLSVTGKARKMATTHALHTFTFTAFAMSCSAEAPDGQLKAASLVGFDRHADPSGRDLPNETQPAVTVGGPHGWTNEYCWARADSCSPCECEPSTEQSGAENRRCEAARPVAYYTITGLVSAAWVANLEHSHCGSTPGHYSPCVGEF